MELDTNFSIPRQGSPRATFTGFLLLILSGLLLSVSSARAENKARLEWDSNKEQSVQGYKVYYGTETGIYTNEVDAGNATSLAIPGLKAGSSYYFVVTAYNKTKKESPPSSEVVFTVPLPGNIRATSLTAADVPVEAGSVSCEPAETTDGSFGFIVTAAGGMDITIHASTDLVQWEALVTVSNPTGRIMIEDLVSRDHAKRFYRVTESPQGTSGK